MLDPGIFCIPRGEPVTSSGWRPRRGKDLLVPRALGKFFPSLVRTQYRAQMIRNPRMLDPGIFCIVTGEPEAAVFWLNLWT